MKKMNEWINKLITIKSETVSKKVSAIYSFLIAYVKAIQFVTLLSD